MQSLRGKHQTPPEADSASALVRQNANDHHLVPSRHEVVRYRLHARFPYRITNGVTAVNSLHRP